MYGKTSAENFTTFGNHFKDMTFEEIKDIVSTYTVGIAGCGGLGSNCAAMLVRSGVKNLVIADFDTISESNLNRQFFFNHQIGMSKANTLRENLLLIDPEANIQSHHLRLDKSNIGIIFSKCAIIVEAFDAAEAKKMIIEVVSEEFPGKTLVCASGLSGLRNAEQMKVVRNGNLVIVGDFEEEVSDTNPPLSPKVSIAAALQANEVIKLLISGQ